MVTVKPTDSIPANGLFGYIHVHTGHQSYCVIAMRVSRDGYIWITVDPYISTTCYFNRATDDTSPMELSDLVREKLDKKVPVYKFDSMADIFKWIKKYHK